MNASRSVSIWAVGDESGGPCLRGKRFLRLVFLRRGGCLLLLAQLGDRLGEDFLVGLESDVGDEAALFAAEQVARSPDVQVLHRDVEPRAQIRELLDGRAAAGGRRTRASPREG